MNKQGIALDLRLGKYFAFDAQYFDVFTDRHKAKLEKAEEIAIPNLSDTVNLIKGYQNVVVLVNNGRLNYIELNVLKTLLKRKINAWVYWLNEDVIESIDADKLTTYKLIGQLINISENNIYKKEYLVNWAVRTTPEFFKPLLRKSYHLYKTPGIGPKLVFLLKNKYTILVTQGFYSISPKSIKKIIERIYYGFLCTPIAENDQLRHVRNAILELDTLEKNAIPVNLDPIFLKMLQGSDKSDGNCIYLRTDYWAPIKTGGSYAHTCYIANELEKITKNLVCYMPHRYTLLDQMNIVQNIYKPPSSLSTVPAILASNQDYYKNLISKIQTHKKIFIYERLCLGIYVGVQISQKLNIPYIIEYNGSEISMSKSFSDFQYEHEDVLLKAEEVAFKQATLISVISENVCEELVRRNVPKSKILVNPNGVDVDAYKMENDFYRELRRNKLGINKSDTVVGFIGTFGGWHGIEVIANSLNSICSRNKVIKFLFIGDGSYAHLIHEAVKKYNLADRVLFLGMKTQQEGKELLGCCDLFIAPHSAHMVDGKFFGSPIKLFEYMALGKGIIASDLEQIGEILAPSIKASNLSTSNLSGNECGVLCKPGSTEEFIEAVLFMVNNPNISEVMGKNARIKVKNSYTWKNNIERLLSKLEDITQ